MADDTGIEEGHMLLRTLAESGATVRWYQGMALTRGLYRRAFAALGEDSNIMKPRALRGLARIRIGRRFTAYPGLWLQCEEGLGPIVIGDDAMLGYLVHIHAYDPVSIGDRVQIASFVMINSAGRVDREHAEGTGAIVIGDDVFIGQAVSILGGVTIGDGVKIAANAVVTRDVPAGAVVAGVPARVISPGPEDS